MKVWRRRLSGIESGAKRMPERSQPVPARRPETSVSLGMPRGAGLVEEEEDAAGEDRRRASARLAARPSR